MSVPHARYRPRTMTERPNAGWTLLVVCSATFMLTLDVTIVSVALSQIATDLHAGLSALQWVVDAYTLPLAGGLLSAAVLGDRIGRLRLFVTGLAVFTVSSLACALAANALQLDLARAVQGVGAAMLFGTALPLLGAAYPEPARRAKAVGAFGASYAAATALGPLIGGVLTEGLGWRWIFLVNVPIGLLTLVGCRWLPESRPETAPGNDWVGAGLLTGGLLTLLLALIRGNAEGWGSLQILGLFAVSALLLGGFVVWEGQHPEPMLSLRLFARPAFAGVAIQSFATGATLVAATYYLALHLQNTVGLSPLTTGIRFLPLTMTAFVAALLTAAVLHRTGTTAPLVAGLVLAGIGLLSLIRLDATGSFSSLVPGFLAAGAGLGIGAAAVASAALASVEPHDAGMATGTVNTFRQVGISAGVAALGALMQHGTTRKAATHLAALPPDTLTTRSALSTLLLVAGSGALAAAILCAVLLTRTKPSRVEPAEAPESSADLVVD
jgi:EmrB/QacA subfamily drug resistance transporter